MHRQSQAASVGYSLQALPSQRTRIEDVISHRETQSDGVKYDSNKELGVDKCVVRLYIDAYFEHIAPLCENGFIHRAIFLQAWNSGTVDPALLKAVCSASAAFMSTDSVTAEQRERWRTEAEAHVWSNIGRPSLVVLQVLLVVISQNCALSRFLALQPLLGMAAKMAYMLRLNHENTQLSTTAREIRRRIMWSIFILDKRLAAGQSDLISCPKEQMHIQLPSNERDFELAISGETGTLIATQIDEGGSTSMGTRAYFCQLSHTRHEILQYTRRVISEGSKAHDSRGELLQLECDLQTLKRSLPESMAFSERNLNLRAYSPHLKRYVMLHAMWHQCHCDLYRFMLPGIRESLADEVLNTTLPEYAIYCQTRAVEHAKALVDIFRTVQKVCDQTPQDPGIGICVFQCTRILIRAFDIGLLGSHSTAIEILSQLKSAADILLPIAAVNQSADQLYKEAERLISTAIDGGPYPDPMREASQKEHIRDNNILDILARIRRRDIERGEEVLQQCPASPPLTGSEVPSDKETGAANERTVEKQSREEVLEESLWYTGLESEHMFGSLDTVFDGFGGPSMNFDPQDLEQL
ncbi:hypothetical protein AAEP93_007585 [Penicillium crustosum]